MPDGHMVATDFNNHRIVLVNMSNGDIKASGREGDWEGQFKRPQGLDVDLEGHVIIADSRNNRIQVNIDPEHQGNHSRLFRFSALICVRCAISG